MFFSQPIFVARSLYSPSLKQHINIQAANFKALTLSFKVQQMFTTVATARVRLGQQNSSFTDKPFACSVTSVTNGPGTLQIINCTLAANITVGTQLRIQALDVRQNLTTLESTDSVSYPVCLSISLSLSPLALSLCTCVCVCACSHACCSGSRTDLRNTAHWHSGERKTHQRHTPTVNGEHNLVFSDQYELHRKQSRPAV